MARMALRSFDDRRSREQAPSPSEWPPTCGNVAPWHERARPGMEAVCGIRHTAPQASCGSAPGRGRWLPLAGTAFAVVLILLVVGLKPYLDERHLLPGLGDRGCDGTLVLNVVTGPELAGLLGQLAGDYAEGQHRVDGRCVQPDVRADEPGAVVHYLARDWRRTGAPPPDVWLPASSTWADVLDARHGGYLPEQRPKVATSPLVIAMPRPMARALGWPRRALGWGDLLAALRNPAGWAAFKRPRWGKVLIGKTDPFLSTAGMQAGV